jgi:hypothetical protein
MRPTPQQLKRIKELERIALEAQTTDAEAARFQMGFAALMFPRHPGAANAMAADFQRQGIRNLADFLRLHSPRPEVAQESADGAT